MGCALVTYAFGIFAPHSSTMIGAERQSMSFTRDLACCHASVVMLLRKSEVKLIKTLVSAILPRFTFFCVTQCFVALPQ